MLSKQEIQKRLQEIEAMVPMIDNTEEQLSVSLQSLSVQSEALDQLFAEGGELAEYLYNESQVRFFRDHLNRWAWLSDTGSVLVMAKRENGNLALYELGAAVVCAPKTYDVETGDAALEKQMIFEVWGLTQSTPNEDNEWELDSYLARIKNDKLVEVEEE